MEDIRIVKRPIRLDSIEGIRPTNNQVLLRQITDNMNTPTKDGIYKASYELHKNQYLASYANRVFEVLAVPTRLTFVNKNNKTSGTAMRWQCDMDVKVGDVVITSYPSVLDMDVVMVGDQEYPLINYRELRIAKRGDKIIPLNGWVMYKHPKLKKNELDPGLREKNDWSMGIVIDPGKQNKCYWKERGEWVDLDSKVKIRKSDVFVKDNPSSRLLLEDPLFRYVFDEDIYIIQRQNIVCIL